MKHGFVQLISIVNHQNADGDFWVNYNNSPTWIKTIWEWFPLLTMIPHDSQWGRSEVVIIYPEIWYILIFHRHLGLSINWWVYWLYSTHRSFRIIQQVCKKSAKIATVHWDHPKCSSSLSSLIEPGAVEVEPFEGALEGPQLGQQDLRLWDASPATWPAFLAGFQEIKNQPGCYHSINMGELLATKWVLYLDKLPQKNSSPWGYHSINAVKKLTYKKYLVGPDVMIFHASPRRWQGT